MFSPIEKYDQAFLKKKPCADAAAVVRPTKLNGELNMNHYAYIGIADRY